MSLSPARRLGIWSLRLDAAYCLILGVLVAAAAPQIATVMRVPLPLLFAAGIIVVVWACAVLWMVSRLRLAPALRLVLGVNIVATALIGAASVVAETPVIAIVVLAVALEVALFAVSQAIAVRGLARGRTA
ncbi:hypothetical protein [Microbacterium sp. NPDC087591]|jgi:hypothetical protein|uniref:hypothetical protein n=1 Tax=Microbacterium sp. NPDC087591 TaxID=3364192 RepID=UPI003828C759